MTLGELATVIDAALGFSGAATHLFVSQQGTTRDVFTETPTMDERDEQDLTVSEMPPMTYVYDPSAAWNIEVEVLGPSQLEGPTPMLVDAAGPDVIESCTGPGMMQEFRAQARLLAAGLKPDVDIVTLMFSYLPVMPPERILDRLTLSDPVSVATRIGFVAEELFFDKASEAGNTGDGRNLADHFESFVEDRPELREVLDLDPRPERNPAVITAVSEFFDEILSGTPPVQSPTGALKPDFIEIMRTLTAYFVEPVPHKDGVIQDQSVSLAIERLLNFPYVDAVVEFLLAAGLIKKSRGKLVLTELADVPFNAEDPATELADNLRRGFEKVLTRPFWRSVVEWFVGEEREPPHDLDGGLWWLEIFGLMEEFSPGHHHLSDDGRTLMHLWLDHYHSGAPR